MNNVQFASPQQASDQPAKQAYLSPGQTSQRTRSNQQHPIAVCCWGSALHTRHSECPAPKGRKVVATGVSLWTRPQRFKSPEGGDMKWTLENSLKNQSRIQLIGFSCRPFGAGFRGNLFHGLAPMAKTCRRFAANLLTQFFLSLWQRATAWACNRGYTCRRFAANLLTQLFLSLWQRATARAPVPSPEHEALPAPSVDHEALPAPSPDHQELPVPSPEGAKGCCHRR